MRGRHAQVGGLRCALVKEKPTTGDQPPSLPQAAADDWMLQDFSSATKEPARTYPQEITSVTGIGADSGGTDPTDRLPRGMFVGEWYHVKPAKIADPDGMCPLVYTDNGDRGIPGEK